MHANAESLKATLEYDFEQEKRFIYKGLNQRDIIEYIAHFISSLWQIHVFGEGNTRTTAIFLIKYLRKLGFKNINNDLFEKKSWYFRNSLVRANYEDLSKGIHKTNEFLNNFFSNLLLGQKQILRNREMHIHFNDTVNAKNDTVKSDIDTVNDTVLHFIKQNNQITATEICKKLNISLSTAKRRIKKLKESGKIERIGSDKTGHWRIISK